MAAQGDREFAKLGFRETGWASWEKETAEWVLSDWRRLFKGRTVTTAQRYKFEYYAVL
jgi:hypothetical protein